MMENRDDLSQDYIAEIVDLWRVFKLGAQQVSALRGINLKVEAGHFIALKGRSGTRPKGQTAEPK